MKTQYINKRNELLAKAQAAIDSGNIAEFDSIHAEIVQLDSDFENQAKAQANLDVLTKKGSTAMQNIRRI